MHDLAHYLKATAAVVSALIGALLLAAFAIATVEILAVSMAHLLGINPVRFLTALIAIPGMFLAVVTLAAKRPWASRRSSTRFPRPR